jgi:hypothetical protein
VQNKKPSDLANIDIAGTRTHLSDGRGEYVINPARRYDFDCAASAFKQNTEIDILDYPCDRGQTGDRHGVYTGRLHADCFTE